MSFIQPTASASPFATSTNYTTTGADTYSQSWISTSFSTVWTASVSGRAIATNATQSTTGARRYYWGTANNYPQSGHLFERSFQTYVAGSDECIGAGNVFTLTNITTLDTATGRTNMMRVGF